MPFGFTFSFAFDAPGGPEPAHLQHLQAALNRLAAFLRDGAGNVKPNVTKYLSTIINTQHQSLEDALIQVGFYRLLDQAFGVQLDNIGEIVQQPRSGQSDAVYLTYLKAKIRVNRSSGSIPDLIGIVSLVNASPIVITEHYPAGFNLELDGQIDQDTANALGAFIHTAKSAGVRGIFIYMLCDPSSVFELDSTTQGLDQGLLAGTIG